jgi:microsomal dipeptidase-like Zn-dependent dipeptidase
MNRRHWHWGGAVVLLALAGCRGGEPHAGAGEVSGKISEALTGCSSIPGNVPPTSCTFYEGFENEGAALSQDYLSQQWTLVNPMSQPPGQPVSQYPAPFLAVNLGYSTNGWAPVYGDNVSILRHISAGEVIPGAAPPNQPGFPGTLGGDYWNSAYPIGVIGDFYFGTADVRPALREPWNFNPGPMPGTFAQDTPRDDLVFEAVSSGILANTNALASRYLSFLIGGYGRNGPGNLAPGANLPYVSYEVEYLSADPGCTGTAYTPLTGVDLYYGYKGSQASIAARLELGTPDVLGATARIAPTATGTETMTLIILDLWGHAGNPTSPGSLSTNNPNAAKVCPRGRIHIYDGSTTSHLNVDEFMVSDISGITNNYPSTPFGAVVTPMTAPNTPAPGAVNDHPPAVYGYADLHTHWMTHMGSGAEPLPTVNANGNRRKLEGLLSQMSFMWGMPYGPSTLPANEVCPSMNNGGSGGLNPCGAIKPGSSIASCTGGMGGTCSFNDQQRDQFLLAACDGNESPNAPQETAGGQILSSTVYGGSQHAARSSNQYNDQNYRSSDSASKFLQLMSHWDTGFDNTTCPQALSSNMIFGCWHGWWGYDDASDMFELPELPFMSTIHQQMYWKWVKRAWQGGLRLVVADVLHDLGAELLLNNYWPITNRSDAGFGLRKFPDAIPLHASDDQIAIQRQVCALENMIGHSENGEMGFAQIVATPAAARAAIANGQLAVVLGTEVNSAGQLRAGGLPPSHSATNEVEFLRKLGIAKVTPIHALDNTLGGAALNIVVYAQESDALNLPGQMTDGANCLTQGNFAQKMSAPDPFFFTNNWLYTNNPAFGQKDSGRPQDIMGHLAWGQISCTGTYDPYQHFDPSMGTFTNCSYGGIAPANYKQYDSQPGCWSNMHFPGAVRAPFVDSFNTVTFSIGDAFASSSLNAYPVLIQAVPPLLWTYGRLSWINPNWADAGFDFLLMNNNGYAPWFNDCHGTPISGPASCEAPDPTSPMQYMQNPAILPTSNAFANGTINNVGLTAAGSAYLSALQQYAMLIDIDHTGATGRAQAYAQMWPSGLGCPGGAQQTEPFTAASVACQKGAYPIFSTHSQPRASTVEPAGADGSTVMNRNERTVEDYEYFEIPQLGGVIGMSTGYSTILTAPGLYVSPALPGTPYGIGANHPLIGAAADLGNSCPGSSASFLQKYLYAAYLGEQSRPFYDFGGPSGILRPSQWRSPGIALGSDMNGVREQIGARFGNTPYACNDTTGYFFQQTSVANQQGAKNAVLYDTISPVDQNVVAFSQAPPNSVPAQPPLNVMRWNPNKTPDIQINKSADLGDATPNPQFTITGFDFNQIGLANIGLEPDMIQDAVNTERSNWNGTVNAATVTSFQGARYSMRYLFRSTEDFIEGWEKAVAWCQAQFPGSPNCTLSPHVSSDFMCDPWPTEADGIGPDATEKSMATQEGEPPVSTGVEHALTDQTPSCQNRCGESLFYMTVSAGGDLVKESCNCFLDAEDALARRAKLCDDFKPWCEWFYQGTDGPVGNVTGGSEVLQESKGCAIGANPDQTFGLGMVACGGSVPFSQAANLCDSTSGYVPCTAAEWVVRPGGAAPVNDYWLANNLQWVWGGTSGNCATTDPGGTNAVSCGDGPMMICAHSGPDAYGNQCNSWLGCGYNSTANEYLGGCNWNQNDPPATGFMALAGTMCCYGSGATLESTCSGDAFAEQSFAPGIGGCAGSVTLDKAASLCAPGCSVCSAQQWQSKVIQASAFPTPPQFDYWVTGAPTWGGSWSQSCSALASGGGTCGGNTPMRVCVDNGTSWDAQDPLGNTCNWDDCGLGGTSPNAYMGGCGPNNPTAGALCCCGN